VLVTLSCVTYRACSFVWLGSLKIGLSTCYMTSKAAVGHTEHWCTYLPLSSIYIGSIYFKTLYFLAWMFRYSIAVGCIRVEWRFVPALPGFCNLRKILNQWYFSSGNLREISSLEYLHTHAVYVIGGALTERERVTGKKLPVFRTVRYALTSFFLSICFFLLDMFIYYREAILCILNSI